VAWSSAAGRICSAVEEYLLFLARVVTAVKSDFSIQESQQPNGCCIQRLILWHLISSSCCLLPGPFSL
jgi:hypothetical protein